MKKFDRIFDITVHKSKETVMTQFINRMIRAAKLDVTLYEEVEADESAMKQAMSVVILSSVATGLGVTGVRGVFGFLIGLAVSLVVWFVWAYTVYIIGVKILPEPQTRADHGQLLRTIGFSSVPRLFYIFGIIPGLITVIHPIISIWNIAAMIVAVRQALDYKSTMRAVAVCFIGWIIQGLLLLMLFG